MRRGLAIRDYSHHFPDRTASGQDALPDRSRHIWFVPISDIMSGKVLRFASDESTPYSRAGCPASVHLAVFAVNLALDGLQPILSTVGMTRWCCPSLGRTGSVSMGAYGIASVSWRVRAPAIVCIPATTTGARIAAIAASTMLSAALRRAPAWPSARQAHSEYGITIVGDVATPGVYPRQAALSAIWPNPCSPKAARTP
jgi:hypothetical protein